MVPVASAFKLSYAFLLLLFPVLQPFTVSYSDFELSNRSSRDVDFCHINDFSDSTLSYHSIPLFSVEEVTPVVLMSHMEKGEPFAVRDVTRDWKAKEKWNEQYFEEVFAKYELFSSTFATNISPAFDSVHRKDIYYGIFLNDKGLAGFLAGDYSYPTFIPERLRVRGRCTVVCEGVY